MHLSEDEDALAAELDDLDAHLRVDIELLELRGNVFADRARGEAAGPDPSDVGEVERAVGVERDRLLQVLFAEDDDGQDVLRTRDILRRRRGLRTAEQSKAKSVVVSSMSESVVQGCI